MVVGDWWRYWGKVGGDDAYHLLVYHGLDVAAVASVLLQNPRIADRFQSWFGVSSAWFGPVLCFLIALHDIGKFSRGFQQLVPNIAEKNGLAEPKLRYAHRHDVLGLLLWERAILPVVQTENGFRFSEHLLLDKHGILTLLDALLHPVFGHHGKPVCADKLHLQHCFTEEDIRAASAFVSELRSLFLRELPVCNVDDVDLLQDTFQKYSWWLAGFVVLCDWLGSQMSALHMRQDMVALSAYWAETQKHAKTLVEELGFSGMSSGPEHSFSEFFSFAPTPLQQAVCNVPVSASPQLFILEDVTGAGKTEAALMLTHRLMAMCGYEGVYMGLPTMATANAMYDRISPVYRSFFSDDTKPSLVLAHGATALSDAFMASVHRFLGNSGEEDANLAFCQAWFADNRKKALLAPFGVGTIDQALLAILAAKHQSLRLWGLQNKVLILDEVHASDAYMHALTLGLLRFHAASGGSVILLSATLTQKMRFELVRAFKEGLGEGRKVPDLLPAYPLLTQCGSGSFFSQIPIETRTEVARSLGFDLFSERDVLIEKVLQKLAAGQCVAWICNTVTDAIAMYRVFADHLSEDCSCLFHARFAMGDRLRIENRVKSDFGPTSTSVTRQGKLVIATQVIEQSMDLDFDVMVSDLAPMDLLIQRAGRLRRHVRDIFGNRLASGATDQRGDVALWVYSSVPAQTCPKTWYADMFPNAAYVYPDHAQLWRTAKWIVDHRCVQIPGQLRALIEYVFDEGDDDVPSTLKPVKNEAEGKSRAQAGQANMNRLCLEDGYRFCGPWTEDIQAMTRLGDPMTTVRLARWDGVNLQPWCADDRHAWSLSEVSVRQYRVAKEASISESLLRRHVDAVKKTWPGKSADRVLLPLRRHAEGVWSGEAIDLNGNRVRVTYSERDGLVF